MDISSIKKIRVIYCAGDAASEGLAQSLKGIKCIQNKLDFYNAKPLMDRNQLGVLQKELKITQIPSLIINGPHGQDAILAYRESFDWAQQMLDYESRQVVKEEKTTLETINKKLDTLTTLVRQLQESLSSGGGGGGGGGLSALLNRPLPIFGDPSLEIQNVAAAAAAEAGKKRSPKDLEEMLNKRRAVIGDKHHQDD